MSEELTADLIDALGEDGFFVLTEAYAGMRLYIPGDLDRSELPAVIGNDNARRLSKMFPGGYIRVPLARELRALRYRDAGATNRDIAKRLGLTESGIDRLFKRAKKTKPGKLRRKKDTRQIELF